MTTFAPSLPSKSNSKHKLPNTLNELITQTNMTNVIGFGKTKRQQLESVLNNLLQNKSDEFIELFKQELTKYYSELNYDLTKIG
ncbi:hypothetical protein [Thalassotalea piscium]|uniref:Uncharacterized protein n=1 Tax=Thalassotalea piscium TaxID=1230533 RepID=A0A7X0NET5_9GAMM|nr:hypothetical protein [Thalassotalea piscium]MBB6542118.1 hypothetical protein [Thalassotalea piscium]